MHFGLPEIAIRNPRSYNGFERTGIEKVNLGNISVACDAIAP